MNRSTRTLKYLISLLIIPSGALGALPGDLEDVLAREPQASRPSENEHIMPGRTNSRQEGVYVTSLREPSAKFIEE